MRGGRVLFVHAHPDDETITTGATIAKYSSLGSSVYVLTCTRGELGEVMFPGLQCLDSSSSVGIDDGYSLGVYRVGELLSAGSVLGVEKQYLLGNEHIFLDQFSSMEYRDSGMCWGDDGRALPSLASDGRSFTAANLQDTALRVAALIRYLRPHVVVTYNGLGGYGHPDHIRAHEVTKLAIVLAKTFVYPDLGKVWGVPRMYFISESVDSEGVIFCVEGDVAKKKAALENYRTQLVVSEDRFALTNLVWQPISALEYFTLDLDLSVSSLNCGFARDDLFVGVDI